MFDARIYRAGLVPLALAALVLAFSVQTPPPPLTAALPPDSFDGPGAFAQLGQLARAHPRREPGGSGDRALAGVVRTELARNGFRLRTDTFRARTAAGRRELENVVGERLGLSNRRIVVVAHRDATTSPAVAELSATAALLELARVLGGRTPNRTLVLASTSGGSAGAAGAARLAGRLGPSVDAVLVLGDLAGRDLRRPLVVPWSNGYELAPFALRATVGAAVRQETGLRPGSPGAAAQVARLALPFTAGEQGVLLEAGLPAVLLSASGDRGPRAAAPVSAERFTNFGRAALRAFTAFEARPGPVARPRAELLVFGKLLPDWALRLVVAALILPGALAAADGFARLRRRLAVGPWLGWVAANSSPFLFALTVAWLLSLLRLMPTPPSAPAPLAATAVGVQAVAAGLGVLAAAAAGWLWLRPLLLGLVRPEGGPAEAPGAAASVCLVLATVVVVTWAFSPLAAALLVPALHAWIALAAPQVRVRRGAAMAIVATTLVPLAAVGLYYALELGAGPASLAWSVLLATVGGNAGMAAVVGASTLGGCLVSLTAILLRRSFDPPVATAPGAGSGRRAVPLH